jgi:hypothetical protein
MTSRRPLSTLTVDQLMVRATEYRRLAATASTAAGRDALNALAVRLAVMAARRERDKTWVGDRSK